MDLVLNPQIDEELKNLLGTAAVLSKDNTVLNNNHVDDNLIASLTPMLTNNYVLNFIKTRNLLHIILYNYNYATVVDDYILEELNFLPTVENSEINNLLKAITNNNDLIYCLIRQYYNIILNDGLLEMLDNNAEIYNNISWLNNWYQLINFDMELITTKLRHLMFELRDYCDYTETTLKDEIFLKFLYENKNYFNLINTYFNSLTEYKSYRFLLCQMLYLDSYYYLKCEKSKRNLSIIEDYQLTYLDEHIKRTDINRLPFGKFTTLKLLDYFFLVNENRQAFNEENTKEYQNMQTLIKKKASKALLFEYC